MITIKENERARCKTKPGWNTAGKGQEGWIYAVVETGGRRWAVVHFDGEDDPDLHKIESLLVQKTDWVSIPNGE